MRRLLPLTILLTLAAAGCNTVHGAGEDIKSIGRVFTDHPDGPKPTHR